MPGQQRMAGELYTVRRGSPNWAPERSAVPAPRAARGMGCCAISNGWPRRSCSQLRGCCRCPAVWDQGVHNHLVYGELCDTVLVPNRTGAVQTLFHQKMFLFDREGRLLNIDGSICPVLHQIDRFPPFLRPVGHWPGGRPGLDPGRLAGGRNHCGPPDKNAASQAGPGLEQVGAGSRLAQAVRQTRSFAGQIKVTRGVHSDCDGFGRRCRSGSREIVS